MVSTKLTQNGNVRKLSLVCLACSRSWTTQRPAQRWKFCLRCWIRIGLFNDLFSSHGWRKGSGNWHRPYTRSCSMVRKECQKASWKSSGIRTSQAGDRRWPTRLRSRRTLWLDPCWCGSFYFAPSGMFYKISCLKIKERIFAARGSVGLRWKTHYSSRDFGSESWANWQAAGWDNQTNSPYGGAICALNRQIQPMGTKVKQKKCENVFITILFYSIYLAAVYLERFSCI